MSFDTVIKAGGSAEPIFRLFRVAFGREPDPSALRTFGDQLLQGASFADLAATIAGSPEFTSLHGPAAPPDAGYINRMFRFAVGHDAGQDVIAALLGEPGGADRAGILVSVASLLRQDAPTSMRMLFPHGMRPDDDLAYELWVERNGGPDEHDLLAIDRHIGRMNKRPSFSLLLVAPMVRPDLLLETIAALDAQVYPDWELCVACPAHLPPGVAAHLQQAARRVPGIRLVQATDEDGPPPLNAALAAATGQFIGLLDCGDQLAPTALYEAAAAIEQEPELSVIYTDEDSIDGGGRRYRPLFKPGWGPDMLLAGDCVGQLVLVRRDRVNAVGGLRGDAGLFTRYDMLLRATSELPRQHVAHVPVVLFHRGRAPGRALPFPQTSAISLHPELRRVLDRHLAESNDSVTINDSLLAGGIWPRASFAAPDPTALVSILISTHEQPILLERCVTGLLERTSYQPIEVVIADHDNQTLAARQVLRRLGRHPSIRVIRAEGPFNWSAINNQLAREAAGSILVLMNDDVDVVTPDWLDELVAQLGRPKVGIAGPCLLYPDGSLQHGGIVLAERSATHILRSARQEAGYLGQLAVVRDLSAVTGACLAVHRAVFDEAGGLAETLPLACNDVDLCLRVRKAGYRVVWTPFATLHHIDGASRGHDRTPRQYATFRRALGKLQSIWGKAVWQDPFLNANLQATDHTLLLASEPRRLPPWRDESARLASENA